MTDDLYHRQEVYEEHEDHDDTVDDEEEIAAMKRRVAEMESEAAKLREMQSQLDHHTEGGIRENREDADARSIFVGNVDYDATPEEIKAHFESAPGVVNRVTILLDRFTGSPKGYAYVEFAELEAEKLRMVLKQALLLNQSEFRGRTIEVKSKRTNIPGMSRGGRGSGRGGGAPMRGGRGGFGGGRGAYAGSYGGYGGGGYGAPRRAGYRGGFRGRFRGYAPY